MYDIAVIGGGPGGYAAALYAHNFGLKVALVEKATVGGVCLTRGCIPAKTWLHAADVFRTVKEAGHFGIESSEPTVNWGRALERKHEVVNQLVTGLSGLLRNRKVDIFDGFGRLAGAKKVIVAGEHGEQEIEANNIIIATGSEASSIPGYEIDGERIVTSDHALDWPERPEKVAIIGAGAIGCEFASLLSDFGTEVHLFEMLDQVVPGSEPQAANTLERALKERGVNVRTGTQVGNPVPVHGRIQVPFGEESVEVDAVLVAVGRAPQTDGIGLDTVNVASERGYIQVDPATQQTSEAGVYAVGDVVMGAPQLAHAGFAEAIAAVTHIATGDPAPVDYRAIPLVVYSHPELASVGMTEAQAKEAGYEIDKTRHPFAGVGRAIIVGENKGLVKIVSEKEGPILGATVVGPAAGEMIHELMYSVAWEALPKEAAAFIHAHPTLSEAVGETLLGAAGRSLH